MTFLKSLWSDLVEKKLWPVAVVLLVALVAVPVALGGGGTTVAATGTTGTTGATGAVAEVALDASTPVRRDRAGAARDPFKQRAVARGEAASTATATAPAEQPATSSPSSTGTSSPGSTGGKPTSPGTTPDPGKATPPREPDDTYLVEVRFGKTDSQRARKEVGRLTPLPSAEDPLFVYLGALSDKKTAVFLLPAGITATGDGSCKPRASSCETVELRAGDTEFLDVTDDDGVTTQYQLDVIRVYKEKTGAATDRGVAARSSDAPSSDDAQPAATTAKAAAADEGLGSALYSFDDETGLLTRVKKSAARAHADESQASSAPGDEPAGPAAP